MQVKQSFFSNQKMATTIPNSGEMRWQCLSGVLDMGGFGSTKEARSILHSTMRVCRQMPVGLSAEGALQALQLQGSLHAGMRWILEKSGDDGAQVRQ